MTVVMTRRAFDIAGGGALRRLLCRETCVRDVVNQHTAPATKENWVLTSGNARQGQVHLTRGFEPIGQRLTRSRVDHPMTLRGSPPESDRGHADLR